jgi:hypothetical protein
MAKYKNVYRINLRSHSSIRNRRTATGIDCGGFVYLSSARWRLRAGIVRVDLDRV